MKTHDRLRLVLTAAIAGSFPTATVLAQQQTPPPAAGEPEEVARQLDAIVVSGAAQSSGLRKRDASFSITTATPEEIDEAAPQSTADLLKIVPGVWAESAAGTAGANIDVRGFPGGSDAPYVTVALDGSPIFPPPTLSFLENSSLFRIDDTIQRVEVLRGGPSPIFANGQPGATINFIQKKGAPVPEGSIRLTTGTGDLQRVDAYYGGPIGRDWTFSLGGFHRSGDGIRDTGFPADDGGQLSGTLTRMFDNGELTVYGRHTQDKNAFFTAVPLVVDDDGDVSEYPGFDAGRDTLLGNDFRYVDIPVTPGAEPGTISRDLAQGRGVNLDVFGSLLDLEFDGWRLSNRMNYSDGEAPTNGLFTGANPQSAAAYIAASVAAANADPEMVAAAGGTATDGSASFVDGSGAVDPDQQVLVAGWWVVDKAIRSFTNETRLSFDLGERNTLTAGLYYADYSSHDRWYLGNEMVLTAEPNARRIDVVLDNGVEVTREGFEGAAFSANNASFDGENIAVFLADEWTLSDALRLDFGLRYEEQQVDALLEGTTSGVDLDGNPLTLSDNAATVRNGSFSRLSQDDDDWSWTVGLNWTLNETASVFARANSGFFLPQFNNIADGLTQTQEVDQYEIGLKSGNDLFDLYLTGFYNEFEGLPFQLFDLEGNNITAIGGSRAYGLEFEGAIRPMENVEIELMGNWLDAKYRNFGENSGNEVRRQPSLQYRISPSYTIPADWAFLKLYGTYTWVDERWSDVENAQRIPSYHTVDLGIAAYLGEHWEVRVSGNNLTDEIGLTEANARVIGGAASDGVFLGRPIYGRNYQFSVAFRF